MKATIENGELVVRVPVYSVPVPSKSGKTRIVATTGGNVEAAGLKVDGKPVTIGLNAYIK